MSEVSWNGDAESNDEEENSRLLGSEDNSQLMTEDTPFSSNLSRVLSTNTTPSAHAQRKSNINTGKKRSKSKRIKAELDTDDEIIMQMHSQGRQDFEISEYLATHRGLKYEPKSLISRINRIVKAQQDHQDTLLEEGLTDWHDDDDNFLRQAYERAEVEIKQEIEKVKSYRWRMTSRFLMALKPASRFSAGACEKRFVGLMDGTAILPPELDPDPKARREAKAARILEKLAREETERQIVEASKERTKRALEDKHRRREEKKRLEAEKPARKAAKIQRSIEKAEKEQARREMKERNERTAVEKAADESKDPRGKLSLEDLARICDKRGLSSEGTKKDILCRIVRQDRAKNIMTLRKEVEERSLKKYGSKDTLLERLAAHEAKEYSKVARRSMFDVETSSEEESSADETPAPKRRNPRRENRSDLSSYIEHGETSVDSNDESPRKKLKGNEENPFPTLTSYNTASNSQTNDEEN